MRRRKWGTEGVAKVDRCAPMHKGQLHTTGSTEGGSRLRRNGLSLVWRQAPEPATSGACNNVRCGTPLAAPRERGGLETTSRLRTDCERRGSRPVSPSAPRRMRLAARITLSPSRRLGSDGSMSWSSCDSPGLTAARCATSCHFSDIPVPLATRTTIKNAP